MTDNVRHVEWRGDLELLLEPLAVLVVVAGVDVVGQRHHQRGAYLRRGTIS